LLIALIYLTVGLLVLIFGADILVRGASRLAVSFGIEPLIVGLTIVAVGTSAPELAVSMMAAVAGHTDISFGNIVGSNVCNIALVLGLCALMTPIRLGKGVLPFLPIMFLSSAAIPVMAFDGVIGRIDGLILLAAATAYVIWMVRGHKPVSKEFETEVIDITQDQESARSTATLYNALLIIGGIVLLVGGSHAIVEGARTVADYFGISERVIGLTLVALDTSLPELATSVIAVSRRETAIGIGNLVGSNISNVLLVLGATSTVHAVPAALNRGRIIDIAVMLGVAAMLILFSKIGDSIKRWQGGIFFASYLAYMIFLIAGL